MEVSMNDLDELYALILELERITYLQGLVHQDEAEQGIVDTDYKSI